VLIGALCFGYFLTITRRRRTSRVSDRSASPLRVLTLISDVSGAGCLMDAMAMVILTVRSCSGGDGWLRSDLFGIVIVMTVELGLIHPPVA